MASQSIESSLRSALLLIVALVALPRVAIAQEPPAPPLKPSVYQPAGAPADPKVSVRWNRYYSYAEATDILQQLVKAHAPRARLLSLGKSYGGRDMWLLTITNPDKGKENEKPAFWIDGGIHANELQGVEVSLYTAWYLLEMYGRSDFITRLVDQRVFYIVPMMSPDSRDAHMTRPNTTHSPRSGQRPVDDDRDGKVDEDGPDDLDGDGHITQMRVKDPHGKWKPHPDYPDLLIRVKDDEKGEYTLLGTEGFDNDGDGRVNEDGEGFYDPNRDWAWNWQPDYVQNGAHRYPFSIGENRLVADFVMAHPNIAGAQSYHNTGGLILRGPGAKDDRFEGADIAVFDAIAKRGELMLPGYRYVNVATGLYEVFGGETDWFYAMQGIFCYTNELFSPFNYFRKGGGEGGFFGNQEERFQFNRFLLFEDGVARWKEVDHPQYGKVEVGGFKKNWTRQAPSFLLEEECHRNMAFTLYHADQMPAVAIDSVTTKPLPGGLTEVTAAITNPHLTPTRSAFDVKKKITPPDRVTITGDNVKVILAMSSDSRFFTRFEEQKRNPAEMRIDSVGGMDAVYVRWIVQGKGPFTVTVRTTKGGVAVKTGN